MNDDANQPEMAEIPVGVRCPECGYDLRGLTSAACPECGFELADVRRGESRVPWVYRGKIGGFRAYTQTVWMVVRWPRKTAEEMAAPLRLGDARRFHRWTALLVTLVAVVGGGLFLILAHAQRWGNLESMHWVVWSVLAWWGLTVLFVPGIANAYLLRAGRNVVEGERAVALAHYAWGALALAGVALLPWGVTLWYWNRPALLDVAAGILAIGCLGGSVVLAFLQMDGIMARALHLRGWQRGWRSVTAGLLLVLLAAVTLLFPLTVFYWAVLVSSL